MSVRMSFLGVIIGLSVVAASASADVQHVVARGHTLQAIANRYRVSVKSIVDANRIKDTKHLKVGDSLTIPGVQANAKDKKKPVTYAMRPKTPGVIHAHRLATDEDYTIRVSDRRGGKLAPMTIKQVEKLLRNPNGSTHPIEPRLVALLGVVSNHFGSRKIEVVSGFRPFSPTQHTRHSNHNEGKAVDFRVVGVPNEVVRDFCRTLRNVGVGYYPNSTFVHLDARATPAYWIDYSKPGEAPRYDGPNVEADEGTSDVTDDATPATPARDYDVSVTE